MAKKERTYKDPLRYKVIAGYEEQNKDKYELYLKAMSSSISKKMEQMIVSDTKK